MTSWTARSSAVINFLDTAEMYAVPRAGRDLWQCHRDHHWQLAGQARRRRTCQAGHGHQGGGPFARHALGAWWCKGMTAGPDIIAVVRRQHCSAWLKTDVIDLYQIHWPERHVPMPWRQQLLQPGQHENVRTTSSIHEQLRGARSPVGESEGKVRTIGLSNETPYGVHEFVRLADQHGLPRVASDAKRLLPDETATFENALGRNHATAWDVSLLAYSPLGLWPAHGQVRRLGGLAGCRCAHRRSHGHAIESVRQQRWGREEALGLGPPNATTSSRVTMA